MTDSSGRCRLPATHQIALPAERNAKLWAERTPAPEYVRIVGKPEVITGPDAKSQLAPSPGKSASRKLPHYQPKVLS